MKFEPWVAVSEKRNLSMPGFSSFSESFSSMSVFMGLFLALDIGWTLLALGIVGSSVALVVVCGVLSCWGVFFVDVVCILFILDPGLLGPRIQDVGG